MSTQAEEMIPDDIRETAYAVVERGYNEGLLEAVCAALLAERKAQIERDMKIGRAWIAEFEGAPIDYVPANKFAADAVNDILDAIRAQLGQKKGPAIPKDGEAS